MYVLVGTCWMAGTVYWYLDPEADSAGTRPLGNFGSEDFFTRDWSALRQYIRKNRREGRRARGEE